MLCACMSSVTILIRMYVQKENENEADREVERVCQRQVCAFARAVFTTCMFVYGCACMCICMIAMSLTTVVWYFFSIVHDLQGMSLVAEFLS